MTEVKQSTLDEQLKVTETTFTELEANRQKAIEQGKLINQQITAIAEEMVRLQGEYRALQNLKDNGQPETPELTIPKKKTSTKKK